MNGLAVLAGTLALALLSACVADAPDPGAAETLTAGRYEPPGPVDAAAWTAGIEAALAPELYRHVVRDGAGGRIVPDAARAWRYLPGGRWVFRLRPGLRFADGSALDARAVAAALERDRVTSASTRAVVRSASAAGSGTLLVRTGLARAAFLRALASPSFVLRGATGVRAGSVEVPLPSGPYVLAEAVPGDHATLARSPEWHDSPLAYRTIVLRDIPDPLTGGLALYKGDIDVLLDPGPAVLAYVRGIPGALVYHLMGERAPLHPGGVYAVRFGLAGAEPAGSGEIALYAMYPAFP